MKIVQFLLKNQIVLCSKVVVPVKGTTAFELSTAFKYIPDKPAFSVFTKYRREKQGIFDSFLRKPHYFRRNCAKCPIPNVVLIEGQTTSPQTVREAAA